jgi:asparagine synthase (glutamine-hydrolysing)
MDRLDAGGAGLPDDIRIVARCGGSNTLNVPSERKADTMCGIAGKLFYDARRIVDGSTIRRMNGVLVHRGPDDEGVWTGGRIGLGHRRLSIIDLTETGHQPMCNERGTVWIAFNGEIYNHLDLRRDLEAKGHLYRGHSDTETIIHLYEEKGPRCVESLRGMFAFALWDDENQTLVLARDRFGKKPLVYAETPQGLVFASELKAILQDESVPAEIDDGALDSYMTWGYIPSPQTIFRGIRKLPPASVLTWQAGRTTIARYWSLAYTPKLEIDEDSAAEGVLELLREATRLRLMSEVPLGAFLSGGVDSSAIVALMAEATSGPVKTFSIGFEDQSFDETPYARLVAKLYGTDHHEMVVTPKVLDVLPEIVWAYGEPYADSSALPSYYVAKTTRQEVTVALNGDGGDEAFAGYERYVAHELSALYGRIPRPIRERVIPALAVRLPETTGQRDVFRRFKRFVLAQNASPARRCASWLTFADDGIKRILYSEEFASRVSGWDPVRGFEQLYTRAELGTPLDRALSCDVEMYLPDDLLVKIDIATMIHSLEARSPFLDHRLAEFVARLPARYKLRGRSRKHILKRALRKHLPRKILERGKFGFGAPVGRWFRSEMRGFARETLTDPRTLSRGIFSHEGVERLLETHASGKVNHGYRIWQLIMLEMWFRTYVDRPREALLAPAEGIVPMSAGGKRGMARP